MAKDKAEPKAKGPKPCPECGGVPGYDEATGVELKDGHRYECNSPEARTLREGK